MVKAIIDPEKRWNITHVDDLRIEGDRAFCELTQDDDQIVLDKDQGEILFVWLSVWLGKDAAQ